MTDAKKDLDEYDRLLLKAEERHQELRSEMVHVRHILTSPKFDDWDAKERMSHAASKLQEALAADDKSYG